MQIPDIRFEFLRHCFIEESSIQRIAIFFRLRDLDWLFPPDNPFPCLRFMQNAVPDTVHELPGDSFLGEGPEKRRSSHELDELPGGIG